MLDQEIQTFMKQPCKKTARILGKAIFLAETDLESKRQMFEQAFKRNTHSDTEAVLNLWAVGAMLEDDLSVVRKIEAVRALLDDAELESDDLNEWIRLIYQDGRIPKDLMDFLETDFKNHPHVSDELKQQISAKILRLI